MNYKKLSLTPSEMIEFLGTVIDSRLEKAHFPKDRFHQLQALLQIESTLTIAAWICLAVSGHMLAYVCGALASLHIWPLQL